VGLVEKIQGHENYSLVLCFVVREPTQIDKCSSTSAKEMIERPMSVWSESPAYKYLDGRGDSDDDAR
jgi:hypothetical protein